MDIDFQLILVIIVLVTGGIMLVDVLFFASKRRSRLQSLGLTGKEDRDTLPPEVRVPLLFDYARSFFPILFIVLLLRSFLFEPYRIPSGSLKPTLLVGDFILISKYAYGLRLPVLHTKVQPVGSPNRGDIVVFRNPEDESIIFIKRIVGVAGDRIEYRNKILTINGESAAQEHIGYGIDDDGNGHSWKVEIRSETINGVLHKIFVRPDVLSEQIDVTIPEGHYFAMGDNRDGSRDSRAWGFVPDGNLIGKALRVWLSWNGQIDRFRWERFWERIA